MRRLSLFLIRQNLNSQTNFNFMYPVRYLRVPPWVRGAQVANHSSSLYDIPHTITNFHHTQAKQAYFVYSAGRWQNWIIV
jgi:hypothetical protein